MAHSLSEVPGSNAGAGIPSSNPRPIIPLHLCEAVPIFRDILDLSSEIKTLGDVAIASEAHADIWQGQLLNGRQVAIKVMTPTRANNNMIFLKESYIWLRVISHEHVLPLLGVARLQDSVAFVSPYMTERSLAAQLSNCSIPHRLRIVTEIAGALAFLHQKNIVYGYLSPRTVVLDQNKKAYLSGFHFCNTDFTELVYVDSMFYPLSVKSNGTDTERTWQQDVLIWGWLLMLVLTRTGRSPVKAQRDRLVMQFLAHREFKEVLGLPDLPEETWILAKACWEEDHTKRPTMDHVFVQMSKILQLVGSSTNKKWVLGSSEPMIRDISSEIKNLSRYPITGGGYCDLYLGERLGKETVALKLVRLFGPTEQDKNAARRRFLSEVKVWADLCHPRILKFYGIYQAGKLSTYMISPFLSNGSIMHYLNEVNRDANRRKLLVEAAEGLVYLHNRDPPIIHGDLKGGNILISDSGNVVLADFGLSRISDDITTSILHGAGSLRWMAPELMKVDDIVVGPLRTLQSDVYGYGHIMLEVLSGEKPFFNIREDLPVVVELLHQRRPARPTGEIASQWLDDISWAYCQQCTNIEPAARPSMNDVLSYLHEIFL